MLSSVVSSTVPAGGTTSSAKSGSTIRAYSLGPTRVLPPAQPTRLSLESPSDSTSEITSVEGSPASGKQCAAPGELPEAQRLARQLPAQSRVERS